VSDQIDYHRDYVLRPKPWRDGSWYEDSSIVKTAWAEWLADRPIDYFATVTFRDQPPMVRQESVTHAVGQSLVARYETLTFLGLFAEPHKSGNLHLHGLVEMNASEEIIDRARRDMQSYLNEKFGRSQVAFPRGKNAVSKYVAKYCVKTGGYYEIW